MREYSKAVKRLIREYAARAYEAELGQALRALEQEFAHWHSGQISAGELSDRVYAFSRGPARELWNRYNAGPGRYSGRICDRNGLAAARRATRRAA